MNEAMKKRDSAQTATLRHDWARGEILALIELPFNDLLYRAHTVHRRHFDPERLQLSTLLNIKTGGCAEDCKYCSQSGHYETGVEATPLMDAGEVRGLAEEAKANGASRFCMGAAWREVRERDMDALTEMVGAVKAAGLETCMTLGMMTDDQAVRLKSAGLDYYNHNLDTSEEYYAEIVTTRGFQDRLDTLEAARGAGLKLCSGGIIGLGEARADRAGLLESLARLDPHPESVPINMLVPVAGTPLADAPPVDPLELARTVAVARILMPASRIRLSAGRAALSDEGQALCYFAGANSIFMGERLLTTDNRAVDTDRQLMDRLGLAPDA